MGQCAGMFTKSVADLSAFCAKHQIPLQLYFMFNESLITRARNYCCDEFMRSDANHLMFIDSDIGFNPQDIIALMALQSQNEDYDIIGGPYPKKCISWEKIKRAVDKGVADEESNVLEKFVGDYVFNPKSGQNQIKLSDPVEVLEIGTGFMMITKKAMSKFQESYKQYMYKPDHVRTEHFDGLVKLCNIFKQKLIQKQNDTCLKIIGSVKKHKKQDLKLGCVLGCNFNMLVHIFLVVLLQTLHHWCCCNSRSF